MQSADLTLERKFEVVMQQSLTVAAPSTATTIVTNVKNLTASIKAEMAVFGSDRKRGRCLEQVYHYLMSILPTSVEAERAFSAAGVLCTKIRSRLGDDTLDTLCFLRSYYQGRKDVNKEEKH